MGEKSTGSRSDARWITALILSLACITLAHYITGIEHRPFHGLFRRLYYIPIILASFRYGIRGGLACSIAVSLLYLPHVIFQWGGGLFQNLEQFLEIVLYNAVGWVTGCLSERETREKNRYQAASRELEQSNRKLRQQAKALLHAEEQIRKAERLSTLGELSAGLAHEIRNPLSSIQGAAEHLADRFSPGEKGEEFARILKEEVERLDGVVARFLDFAKTDRETQSTGDAAGALRAVLDLTEPERNLKGIRLEDKITDQKLIVPIDGERLREVFLNLVLNAHHAMPSGGVLRVEARKDGGDTLGGVEDTGHGIPKENINNIFDPFYTLRPEGTGLGLSIVHKIVSEAGGTINVSSEPGTGTRFTIRLPKGEEG